MWLISSSKKLTASRFGDFLFEFKRIDYTTHHMIGILRSPPVPRPSPPPPLVVSTGSAGCHVGGGSVSFPLVTISPPSCSGLGAGVNLNRLYGFNTRAYLLQNFTYPSSYLCCNSTIVRVIELLTRRSRCWDFPLFFFVYVCEKVLLFYGPVPQINRKCCFIT